MVTSRQQLVKPALWTIGVLIAANLLGPHAWWMIPPALFVLGTAIVWAHTPEVLTPRFLAGIMGGLVLLSVVLKLVFK